MANMTANEQFMLELVNRARMDPNGEAKRMGIGLNDGIGAGTISSTPKQVLAGNDKLAISAETHSSWMLSTDTFSHTGSRGSTPTDRMRAAGYDFSGLWENGENISLVGSSDRLDLTESIIQQHKNLFLSTHGHRQNILGDDFREAGIGQVVGDYKGYNTSMVTQNYAKTGDAVFVTGVVYNDTIKNDDFFTPGEQTAKLSVVATGRLSDATGEGGGYELAFGTGGSKTVQFNTATGAVSVSLSIGNSNIKLDLVNGKEIWANANVTSLTTTVTELHALGISNMSMNGSSGSEKIYGNSGINGLYGNAGNDLLIGNGGNDVLGGGAGIDTMTGGAGNDKFIFKVVEDSGVDKLRDTITDFDLSGDDTIDLSAFVPPLAYRGTAAIGGINQVNVTASGSDVIVHVNLDTDLVDEMQILLKGVTLSSMTQSDFIL